MANQQDQAPRSGAQATGKNTAFEGSSSSTGQTNQTSQPASGNISGQTGDGISDRGSMMSERSGTGTATARSLYDQAKETASEAYEVAAEKATTKLEEQKTTLSSGLATVADSVRRVSQNLKGQDVKDGMAKFTADYSDAAAQKIEQVANYFERKDVRAMYNDIENFARRNPAMFIGGAFAIGLLAARFLKSETPNQMAAAAGESFGTDRGGTGTTKMNRRDIGTTSNPPIG